MIAGGKYFSCFTSGKTRADRYAVAQRFGQGAHIGKYTVVLEGEKLPGTAYAGLDFIKHHQQVMLIAQTADLVKVIGGRNIERILYNYRLLTGFPHNVPLWSYGVWMGRMTYFTAKETQQVATRLREESFPCDVIHVDTGWFDKDWICEWEFSPRTFPEPQNYLREMRLNGFRITLWQLPSVSVQADLYTSALENRYIASKNGVNSSSNFGGIGDAATIDFTNPDAIVWYQGLLEKLLRMGVAAIKTDFGENIDLEADYQGMDAKPLHNLYSLLYQKAAFDITEKVKGEGLIWARAGWIGNHRYPVHWGGDSASTWDGMAGSLRGGLHFHLQGTLRTLEKAKRKDIRG